MLVDIVFVVIRVLFFFFIGGVKRLFSFILSHGHHLLLHLNLLLHLHGAFRSVLLHQLSHVLLLFFGVLVVLRAGGHFVCFFFESQGQSTSE
jgi:hypothetical protein